MERMSSAPTAVEIVRDATWLAQALDPTKGMVRLVAMARDSYRAASFLDDRMLVSPVDAQILPWTTIEDAVTDTMRSDARWIFHIGHVGSTLVSRLLGEIECVLALREPRLLRDVALTPAEVRGRYVRPVPRLVSRTFGENEIACVKATSFTSEIAHELVPAGERALFMYAAPRIYIASILAGENSVMELRALARSRNDRMSRRVEGVGDQSNDARRAAAAWACEMTSLESAADAMQDRMIFWADFDRMLEDMPQAVAKVSEDFGFCARSGEIEAIVGGPLMKRYSKALEYEYSPNLRRELIAETEQYRKDEIDGALAMLNSAAERSPLLARALSRAEARS
jgi:hypothetical protein